MNKEGKINFKRRKVYFEKQSNDRLCGVHCLNSLLQGPYFDAFSLSEIGLKLDEMERQIFQSKTSENVDMDGNYNIQVLSEALKNHGCEIIPMSSSEANKLLNTNYDNIEAFIFNSSTHWYSMRKIDNVWFDLNSTNPFPGPKIISEFYLSAYLKGTEEVGYTNFLVKNVKKLEPIDSYLYMELLPYQKLVDIEDIMNNKPKKQEPKKKSNDSDDEEQKKKEEEEKNKFKAFTGKGYTIEDQKSNQMRIDDVDDNELKQAMELSLNDHLNELTKYLPIEPLEGEFDSFNIVFRYEGNNFSRRFKGTDKIIDLKNFLQIKIRTFNDVEISEAFPRKIHSNPNIYLNASGFSKNQILNVKIIN